MFREALASAGMLAIDSWWSHLDDPAREDALRLWQDCNGADSSLLVRVEGHFVDDEEDGSDDFWHNDYYDYLVNHEVYLLDAPRFHVCTAHPVSAAAARAGFIPADFTCPLQRPDCPMERLLNRSPGKAFRLRIGLGVKPRINRGCGG